MITSSPAQAEDAVHDAFCRLLRTSTDADDVKAFVFRAVRNAALDQVRSKATPRDPLPDAIFDPNPSPGMVAEQAEFKQRVVDLMQKLTADERETIVMHLYGGLTFKQIAIVRRRPMGTIVSWYRRGIEKLQSDLESVEHG